jgi:hypothetical protein
MVDENRNNEIGETHARENQSGKSSERPQRHGELSFWFPGALECEDEADGSDHNSDGGQGTEDDEKNIVGQNGLLFFR